MNRVDRVAFIGWMWSAVWGGIGYLAGWLFEFQGTGLVFGIIFALITVFLWPWVLPEFIDDWMSDPGA